MLNQYYESFYTCENHFKITFLTKDNVKYDLPDIIQSGMLLLILFKEDNCY